MTGTNESLCGTTHRDRREIIAGQQFEGQHADSGFPGIRASSRRETLEQVTGAETQMVDASCWANWPIERTP